MTRGCGRHTESMTRHRIVEQFFSRVLLWSATLLLASLMPNASAAQAPAASVANSVSWATVRGASSLPTDGVRLEDSPQSLAATPVDLANYVAQVAQHSLSALDLEDQRTLAGYRLATEEDRFRTTVRPIANLAVDSTTRPRTGIEFAKRTRLGVNLNAGYATDGFGGDARQRSYLRASIPVLQGFGRAATELPLNRANVRALQQELDYRQQHQNLLQHAVTTYLDVVISQRQAIQAQDALNRAEAHNSATRARYSIGLVSKVDVHRAELGRYDSLDALELSELDVLSARERFIELAQLRRSPYHWPTTLPQLQAHFPDNLDVTVRPEWQHHLLDVRLATLEYQDAERSLLPGLRFDVGYLGRTGGGFADGVDDQVVYSLRLDSDLNFRAKKRRIAAARLHNAALARRGVALARELQLDANQSARRTHAATRRLELARQRALEAESALAAANLRFERGLATGLDVLDALDATTRSNIGVLQAQANQLTSVLEQAKAHAQLSQIWLERAIEPPLQSGEVQ